MSILPNVKYCDINIYLHALAMWKLWLQIRFVTGSEKGRGTLDVLLCTTYCRSQLYLSRQLSQLHPELTMPMFSEITARFQTARTEVRQLLLQYLLPWLVNIELVDPNVPPANPLSYIQVVFRSEGPGWRFNYGHMRLQIYASRRQANGLFHLTRGKKKSAE
ncbi:jg2830 [Pararge aegeria aegeria]|uniref:Jg2830 protein n=1 Tax=Pararge aegeria aegeria TaxID=348720 RepID=A0A8S4QUV2_9NEOP|nr:jg2830 [Pararge aegeria aegeria]